MELQLYSVLLDEGKVEPHPLCIRAASHREAAKIAVQVAKEWQVLAKTKKLDVHLLRDPKGEGLLYPVFGGVAFTWNGTRLVRGH